jgi:pyrroline-5-carboxylate reductase
MTIGFIGAGSMGGAMIEGLIGSGTNPGDILVKGGTHGTADCLQEKLKFTLTDQYQDFKACRIIVVAVGTGALETVFKQLSQIVTEKNIVLSVAAASSIAGMQQALGDQITVAHAIPNTPVSVGEGVIGVSYGSPLSEADKSLINQFLSKLGKIFETTDAQLGILGTVAGCSPAFIDVFIEALSDAGVLHGLPRKQAYEIAEQTLLGTAKLALESGKNPTVLKDAVTSPGGTTIKGIAALEKNGFRNAIIEAITAANNG